MVGGKHLWPWRAIGSQCEVPNALMRLKPRLSQDPALNRNGGFSASLIDVNAMHGAVDVRNAFIACSVVRRLRLASQRPSSPTWNPRRLSTSPG